MLGEDLQVLFSLSSLVARGNGTGGCVNMMSPLETSVVWCVCSALFLGGHQCGL